MGEGTNRMVKWNEERKLDLTSLFRAFDYDSSGSIEPQEFLAIGKAVKAASAKGGEWTEEMSAKAMARVDTDGGGSIDVDEFCGFFEKNMPKNRTQEQFCKLMLATWQLPSQDVLPTTSKRAKLSARLLRLRLQSPTRSRCLLMPTLRPKRGPRCISTSRNVTSSAVANTLVLLYAAEYASEEKSLVRQR